MNTATQPTADFFDVIDNVVAAHAAEAGRAPFPTELTVPFEETLEGLYAAIDNLGARALQEPPSSKEVVTTLRRTKGLLKTKDEYIKRLRKANANCQSYIRKLSDTIGRKKERIEQQQEMHGKVCAKSKRHRSRSLDVQLGALKYEHRALMKQQPHVLYTVNTPEAKFDFSIKEMEVCCEMFTLKLLKQFREHKALYHAARNGRKPTQAYYDKLLSLQHHLTGLKYDWHHETQQYTLEANEREFHGVDNEDVLAGLFNMLSPLKPEPTTADNYGLDTPINYDELDGIEAYYAQKDADRMWYASDEGIEYCRVNGLPNGWAYPVISDEEDWGGRVKQERIGW